MGYADRRGGVGVGTTLGELAVGSEVGDVVGTTLGARGVVRTAWM